MRDLAKEIPDVKLLMALTPEELAGKLLFVLRRRLENGAQYLHLSNTLNRVTGNYRNDSPYSIDCAAEVKIAISEAWPRARAMNTSACV